MYGESEAASNLSRPPPEAAWFLIAAVCRDGWMEVGVSILNSSVLSCVSSWISRRLRTSPDKQSQVCRGSHCHRGARGSALYSRIGVDCEKPVQEHCPRWLSSPPGDHVPPRGGRTEGRKDILVTLPRVTPPPTSLPPELCGPVMVHLFRAKPPRAAALRQSSATTGYG
ncbi:uncharacterized protein LOC126995724 [Eriocheir sinensis]|uniref:uncharacterized protein LOC126995724 n=1 Tax=Eriocheir sinensis TaxID=95602 RepID=UPI0021C869A0|nr:uncharacterized protein LOC126995724 [Eriocheir sinensis]